MKTTFALVAALGLAFSGGVAQAAISTAPSWITAFGDSNGDRVLSGVEMRRAERRLLNYDNRN